MTVLDSFDLTGKRALVTGANRGLGRAFAVALAEAGASVAITGRDAGRNADVLAELKDAGHTAVAITGDVTQRADVERMLVETVDGLGGVDILVNNAGLCIHKAAFDVPDAEFDQIFDLNVRGLWLCSTVFGRHLADSGGGVIVNVGSISALIVNRPQLQATYNASKAAVHQLTKSLAAEWAPHNIRINALAPGYVKTEMAPVDRPEFRRMWIEDSAQQRYATPEEIAPSVLYLASDASAFMTGSVLVIDGGYTIY
ncbi:SDR family NAD(P)-dependent oxidoreductase [Fodinicola acaciae]|uniref:SDR family NAD(P)-dependent oxidoreductase n=1 Tax=Fodinicola acaciae TaxID=2681555 RepID=UPI0013D43C06|nr:glucose 1-dehydrogenase [Fodinicola acaciae]